MELISAEFAALNNTVTPPVYSWVGIFKNFITPKLAWDSACNSTEASVLGFDQQMAKFVQINTASECCQSFGICGDQFALDVIFDETGIVSTTRFRFQHKLQKSQGDLIKGLV